MTRCSLAGFVPYSGNDTMIDRNELEREEEFWDKIGTKWLQGEREALLVRDPRDFLSGSIVAFRHLESILGDVRGKTILDYGCGSGWLSSYFAMKGATVLGFDISGKLVELAAKRAEANGVSERAAFKKMIAEKLEYKDETFDFIIGISILHHISLEEGSRELFRVLKPGGKALFIEPLGESKFFDYIRNHLFRLHHGEIRKVDAEHPLTYSNIEEFGKKFTSTTYKEFQLFEMIARVTGDRLTELFGFQKLDNALLERFPQLRKHSRLVVITYQK
jgi:2-polyprenyl-3-methyl-5-hydroxy-6-metoxy-1,4-benzoquinol methylase